MEITITPLLSGYPDETIMSCPSCPVTLHPLVPGKPKEFDKSYALCHVPHCSSLSNPAYPFFLDIEFLLRFKETKSLQPYKSFLCKSIPVLDRTD